LHPLQTVQGQRTINISHAEPVLAQDLQISQLVSQAKLVICLQLASMTGATQALEVLPPIGIAELQAPNQPCRDDVIHMPLDSSLREVLPTGFDLAPVAHSQNSEFPPLSP